MILYYYSCPIGSLQAVICSSKFHFAYYIVGFLILVVVLAVFFYRPFCKWICPLGAFYALFNKVSLYRLRIDADKCTSCGACSKVCKMDVDVFRTPNHAECIRCGDCIRTCPHQAICRTFSWKSADREKGKSL